MSPRGLSCHPEERSDEGSAFDYVFPRSAATRDLLSKGYIGLYIPPPIIGDHEAELEGYTTTKSAIHLPADRLPVALVRKLIRARMRHNEDAAN